MSFMEKITIDLMENRKDLHKRRRLLVRMILLINTALWFHGFSILISSLMLLFVAQAWGHLQQLQKRDRWLEDVALQVSATKWWHQQVQAGEQSTPSTGQTTQPWPSVWTRSVNQVYTSLIGWRIILTCNKYFSVASIENGP